MGVEIARSVAPGAGIDDMAGAVGVWGMRMQIRAVRITGRAMDDCLMR